MFKPMLAGSKRQRNLRDELLTIRPMYLFMNCVNWWLVASTLATSILISNQPPELGDILRDDQCNIHLFASHSEIIRGVRFASKGRIYICGQKNQRIVYLRCSDPGFRVGDVEIGKTTFGEIKGQSTNHGRATPAYGYEISLSDDWYVLFPSVKSGMPRDDEVVKHLVRRRYPTNEVDILSSLPRIQFDGIGWCQP